MKALLSLALLSPITELFPDLQLSWWPFGDDIGVISSDYRYMRSVRMFATLIVWIPIFVYLQGILPNLTFQLLVFDMIVAFYLRALDFRENRLSDQSTLPGFLYSIGMLIIAINLNTWYSVGTLLTGALLISLFRNTSMWYIDWLGRIGFAGGFTSMLFYI